VLDSPARKEFTRDNHTPPGPEVLCLFRVTHVPIRCSATVNGELQHSLESAQTGWRALIYEHAAFSKVQEVAQRQAGEARWLEGVAEATTALAHEVNNPLTALLVNVEFLEAGDADQATEIAEIQAAALRIAAVVKRLTNVANARSVAYLGESRMLDLSPEEPDSTAMINDGRAAR